MSVNDVLERSGPRKLLALDGGGIRGLITVEGTKLSYVACGVVTSDGDLELALRLKQLHDRLTEVVRTWTPDEVAVEETFVNKDAQATLKLGQARAMSLLVPALHGLPVAEKEQVLAMVKVLLPKADPKKSDAADALAIAIAHAHHRKARALAASF